VNRNETIDLLTLCAAYDQRTVGEADVVAWQTVLGLVDARDAGQAVVDHYKSLTRRVMPADVLAGVEQIRLARLTAHGPITEDEILAHLDEKLPEGRAWVLAQRTVREQIMAGVA
jgi:hypothetical protein